MAVSVLEVLEVVSESYHLTPDDLRGRARDSKTTLARHVAMYLARELTQLSFPALGEVFERDHSTVQSGVRSVAETLSEGGAHGIQLCREVAALESELNRPSGQEARREARRIRVAVNTWLAGLTPKARDRLSGHDMDRLVEAVLGDLAGLEPEPEELAVLDGGADAG